MSRRGPGEGSIYQGKDGRWIGRLSLGYDTRGKRRRKVVYGKSQREVREKLERLKVDVARGVPVSTDRAPTVGEVLDDWLEHRRPDWSPSTYRRHATIVQAHLKPALGRLQVTKLTTRHVQHLLDELRGSGRSPRTIQYVRGVLRAALNQAIKWDLVGRNVAALADAPVVAHEEVKPLTTDQARTFLDVVASDRLGPLYTVAVATGMRQSEIVGLRWEDVDPEAGVLRVSQTIQHVDGRYHVLPPKTKLSAREVPIPPEVGEVLRKHRILQLQERLAAGAAWQDSGLVFTNERGGPLHGPTVTRRLQRVLKEARLPRMRFHDLRHTAASLLLALGVPMEVIQRTLGHSSITTTANIYSHVMPEVQQRAAARMGAFLRGEA